MTVGDRLNQLREEKKLTLEEVGKRIGISKQTMYKYENGIVTNIPSDRIEKLAQIYQVSPAYIMGWEEKEDPVIIKFKRLPEELKDNVEDYMDFVASSHSKTTEEDVKRAQEKARIAKQEAIDNQ